MPRDKTVGTGPGPVIILVDPQMGENIGAAARAMLNFGLTRLRLVRPRDGWPNPKASAMAAGAAPVVDAVRVFDSVEEAIADCHFVLATTARQREVMLPVYQPSEAAQTLRHHMQQQGETCAILFGGERSGLNANDAGLGQGILTIPVNPGFSSLNLAQAVLLVAYEWGQSGGAVEAFASPMNAVPVAEQVEIQGLVDHMLKELDAANYFYPETKRDLMERNIAAAFRRGGFTSQEVQTLRGIVKALAHGRGRMGKKPQSTE